MDAVLKIFHTVSHLRFTQIAYQLKKHLYAPRLRQCAYKGTLKPISLIEPLYKEESLHADGTFTFLNITEPFFSWDAVRSGLLWAYNLNYMDWLQQSGMDSERGALWMDKFIGSIPSNAVGLDPYPTALRGINWIKFLTRHPEACSPKRIDSLYSQYRLLERKIEYHLLGNHLLEDACSLFIGGIFFEDKRMAKVAASLLKSELKEQILPDGAHFEQSPMYHCIVLERLLDVYNFSANNHRFSFQEEIDGRIKVAVEKMLGHLDSITWQDNSIPLFNDSAVGIAPSPARIKDYAKANGMAWSPRKMEQCGFRKYANQHMEAIVDVGGITAAYQPGHSHADTFSYELRMAGKPFIVDTGTSTYNPTGRRQYERSTKAHNTVTTGGRDSSEIWGAFRVGRRAKVRIEKEGENTVVASHDGFGRRAIHTRSFRMSPHAFEITDTLSSLFPAVSRIHFAPGVDVLHADKERIQTNLGTIKISSATGVRILGCEVSTRWNTLSQSAMAEIDFVKELTYSILA